MSLPGMKVTRGKRLETGLDLRRAQADYLRVLLQGGQRAASPTGVRAGHATMAMTDRYTHLTGPHAVGNGQDRRAPSDSEQNASDVVPAERVAA